MPDAIAALRCGGFLVAALHNHEQARLAYVPMGRYLKWIGRAEGERSPGAMFEPPHVKHAERYGHDDVRMLLIELSAACFDALASAYVRIRSYQPFRKNSRSAD